LIEIKFYWAHWVHQAVPVATTSSGVYISIMDAAITITPATGPSDMALMRELFREYRAGVGDCHCFDGFETEIADLPGRYRPPHGTLLIARDGEQTAGGVALAAIHMEPSDVDAPDADADMDIEMKRLYVRPPWRGNGLGRHLTERVIDMAQSRGQRWLYLDTLPAMIEARRLYTALGFVQCPPFSPAPTPGAIYMRLDLS